MLKARTRNPSSLRMKELPFAIAAIGAGGSAAGEGKRQKKHPKPNTQTESTKKPSTTA